MTDPHLVSGPQLALSVGFGLLDAGLARDVRAGLRAALGQGVVFSHGTTLLAIFRQAVATAIGRIHEDGCAPLFLRFLKDGPYEDVGEIPAKIGDKCLTDDETTAVIAFIYSHMVNCFKGALTELLVQGGAGRRRLRHDVLVHGEDGRSTLRRRRAQGMGADDAGRIRA